MTSNSFLPSPPHSLSSLTFEQMENECQATNCHGNNFGLVPRRQHLQTQVNIPKWHGRHLICLRNSVWSQLQGQQQREGQWKRAYQRRPAPLAKRQRHSPFPAKISTTGLDAKQLFKLIPKRHRVWAPSYLPSEQH